MRQTGAKNSGWHTCGAGVPPRTGFSFSFASRMHLHSAVPITVFTYVYETLAYRFSEHDRYRMGASFASKDFLRENPIFYNSALNAL